MDWKVGNLAATSSMSGLPATCMVDFIQVECRYRLDINERAPL